MTTDSRRRLGRTLLRAGLAGASALSAWIVFAMYADPDDVLRAYPSPEVLDGTRIIELASLQTADRPSLALDAGDFDGDGTRDELAIEYHHMEPLFSRDTSALAYVYSGRSHAVLLAREIDCPFTDVHWCGDVDGNGTDDLFVDDDGRPYAMGVERAR